MIGDGYNYFKEEAHRKALAEQQNQLTSEQRNQVPAGYNQRGDYKRVNNIHFGWWFMSGWEAHTAVTTTPNIQFHLLTQIILLNVKVGSAWQRMGLSYEAAVRQNQAGGTFDQTIGGRETQALQGTTGGNDCQ